MRLCALILAGGRGTRLAPVLPDCPKVLAPVAGRPFLAYLLDQLVSFQVGQLVLATGYQADRIVETFGSEYRGLEIRYSREDRPLGTGGALRKALSVADASTLLVLNGDSFCRFELAAFLAWHEQRRSEASLLLTQVADSSRFGLVDADAEGQVLRFSEKGSAAGPGWINAGVYLLARHRVEQIPANRPVSLEYEVFPAWQAQGLWGYRGGEQLLDIGTPDSYEQAARHFAGGLPQ